MGMSVCVSSVLASSHLSTMRFVASNYVERYIQQMVIDVLQKLVKALDVILKYFLVSFLALHISFAHTSKTSWVMWTSTVNYSLALSWLLF